ncbi:hypothetical protein CONPUDRAFT_137484, partial [Coniophora puteana RWD-64-598 SS2]
DSKGKRSWEITLQGVKIYNKYKRIRDSGTDLTRPRTASVLSTIPRQHRGTKRPSRVRICARRWAEATTLQRYHSETRVVDV